MLKSNLVTSFKVLFGAANSATAPGGVKPWYAAGANTQGPAV